MRRRLPFLRTLLGLAAALLLVSAVVAVFVRIDRVVVAHGVLRGGSVPVRVPLGGRIVRVHVQDGQQVARGDALFDLDVASLQTSREGGRVRAENLEGRLRSLEADHQRLVDEIHPRQREQARLEIERAQLQLGGAAKRFERMAQLGSEGLVTKIELDQIELEREMARISLESAQERLPQLEVEQRDQLAKLARDRSEVEARLAEERTLAAEVERLMSGASVMAHVPGVIVATDLGELLGSVVSDGEPLARIASAPADRFEGSLSDVGRPFVETGMKVKIRLHGYPWLLHGTVAGRVGVVSEVRDGAGGFPTTIRIDDADPPGALYEGMRGEARIVIEEAVPLGRLLVEELIGSERR